MYTRVLLVAHDYHGVPRLLNIRRLGPENDTDFLPAAASNGLIFPKASFDAFEQYQLRKQYENGLEEHRKALSKTFKELSARYEANAKQEIAKAVASVKANEQSAEESAGDLRRAY